MKKGDKMTKKVFIFVVGTRPEAIKMAPVIKRFKQTTKVDSIVCVSGQHQDLVKPIFDLFDINIDYDLGAMNEKWSLPQRYSEICVRFSKLLATIRPSLVFVHGDTATTFACSLACYLNMIKVAHVEAGLRTEDLFSPWPEEGNRRLTSMLSQLHFAPTEGAKQKLISCGVEEAGIFVTGNTVIDALQNAIELNKTDLDFQQKFDKKYDFINFNLDRIVVVTVHRRENQGKILLNIIEAIKVLAEEFQNVPFILPVHPNPDVRKPIIRPLGGSANIHLVEPVLYRDFCHMISKAIVILSDSGGIQEEAPSVSVPVIILRETTERPEAVESGNNYLVGTETKAIIDKARQILNARSIESHGWNDKNPYGDGLASQRIYEHTMDWAGI